MIKNILKGFIIGLAKIMPGVSGSMLAISLGVYEKLLQIIADIRHININKFKFLISFFLGALLSICIFSKTIKWILNNFYFPILLLFIGLIIGGFPDIIKEIKPNKTKIKHITVFILSFTCSYMLTLLKNLNITDKNLFTYFTLGLIEAFSSIVPGISGTAIYLSLGVYDLILDYFSNIFNPLYLKFTIFFTLGILIGIFILAKTITYLLKKHKQLTFYGIFGFMVSSIIVMLKTAVINITDTSFTFQTIFQIIIGLILLPIGYKLTIKINNLLSKN